MSGKIKYAEAECTDMDLLMNQIAKGNTDALAQLYQLTSASVYSYALTILKNSQDAEDVLHDCFVRVYQSASGYQEQRKLLAWILTITKHLCMDKLRERNKVSLLQDQDWRQYIDKHSGMSPEDKLVLSACMQQLDDDERQIVVLHAVSGFLHREIAQLMGMPLSTVASKYHRSIKKLKNYLGKEKL